MQPRPVPPMAIRRNEEIAMNSDPNSVKPLQFDTAVSTVSASESRAEGVTCAVCGTQLRDEYYDVNAHQMCSKCRNEIAQLAETPRAWSVFARACAFGLVAAILGAILYYAVIKITDFEIGIVAIAIGYMVGYGIRMGTKGRGGLRFQIVAVVLTYWAVGLAYMPIALATVHKPATEEASANASAPANAAEPPADTAAPNPMNLPLALALLVGISFALPVLTVVGSLPGGLISAAIISFGMMQAWRMTAAPHVVITGPYRIGAGPPALA